MKTKHIDVEALQKLSTYNSTCETLTIWLQLRERNRATTHLGRLKTMLKREGSKIDNAHFLYYWKTMERLGVGHIEYGTRNALAWFHWHYRISHITSLLLIPKAPESVTKPSLNNKVFNVQILINGTQSDIASVITKLNELEPSKLSVSTASSDAESLDTRIS